MNRMLTILLPMVLLAALLLPVSVRAQAGSEETDKLVKMVTGSIKAVYWGTARSQGKLLQPPSETEREIFHIPATEEEKVVKVGMNNAKFTWCKLDTNAYFKKFMKIQKESGKWNVYQLAYMSLLAGASESVSAMPLAELTCSDPIKRELEAGYAKSLAMWDKDAKRKEPVEKTPEGKPVEATKPEEPTTEKKDAQ